MESSVENTIQALADPVRRAILLRLAEGEATVTEIARPFAISQPAISRHLKILEEAGLIARRIDGARRPCRLLPERLAEIEAWIAMLRRASGGKAAPKSGLGSDLPDAHEMPEKDRRKPKKKRKKHK